jgi:hypothetical protein
VIGERVRDKIAASKRRGIWVGGPVPLGYRSKAKKLEVVPEDAGLVRKIFEDYLRRGSIGELAAALEREGIRPRPRTLLNGVTIATERFMVGPIAHILKNRFYIGEVVYRGETNKGEHDPILDRELFEAVQSRLAQQSVSRKIKSSKTPSFLAGMIFDDRGHAMSPSHANKKGVRYRYYVSQALLQSRKSEAGSVARVSAPDVEQIVCNAIRETYPTSGEVADRDLIARYVQRVTIYTDRIRITLRDAKSDDERPADEGPGSLGAIEIPFAPNLPIQKGIARTPAADACIDPREREALLQAIARARTWMNAVITGRAASFEDIAASEGLGVRHVRRLAPLAFLSPKIVQSIADGTAPSGLTVSFLTQALPHAWSAQEQTAGLR